jgi:hypothetical protein
LGGVCEGREIINVIFIHHDLAETSDVDTLPPNLELLRERFMNRAYLLTAHASDRAAERGIFSHEIEEVISTGEVIEDYPDDKYGPSCLIMGKTEKQRILHIQVSYPEKIVKVITVYQPSPDEWEADWKTRKV